MGIHGFGSIVIVIIQPLPILGKGFYITVVLRITSLFLQRVIQINSGIQTFVVSGSQIVFSQTVNAVSHGISIFGRVDYRSIGSYQPVNTTVGTVDKRIEKIALCLIGQTKISFITKTPGAAA